VLIIVELYSNESTIDDHGMLTRTSIDLTRALAGPVTRVGPTGAGPQQKSSEPRQK